MWLAIKIGVFYGVPGVALVLAIAYFAVLQVRVRRGTITRRKAAVLYPLTSLLPIATVIAVWGTAEVASYFAVASDQYTWDRSAAWQLLLDLLPIAAYVGIPIAVLVVVFWLTLAYCNSHE